ncbi:MAG: hypothetical protein KI790_08615 [Cyclobacteriaceae bacterium]|nr:hypothetical protein [Cyclobacteriaceae bacterium HetDA_MAG_MS6]
MKILFFLLLITVTSKEIGAQSLKDYLKNNAVLSPYEKLEIEFSSKQLLDENLIFFGFIHGSAAPQYLDFKLLEYLVRENGLRYYAPEVDYSQAYFLNLYLKTGRREVLDFVVYFYSKRIPQDASTALLDKWQKIYALNQSLPEEQKIKIIGTDYPSVDKRIAITHLANLVKGKTFNHPMLDSLAIFQDLSIDDRNIWSGKPAAEKIREYGGYTYDYVYPLSSRYNFSRRFMDYYKSHKKVILQAVGDLRSEFVDIMEAKSKKRETHIIESFKSQVIPLIESGYQVYSNFGYGHIHQSPISGFCPLACALKNEFPAIKLVSILGLLAKSKVLKETKMKKDDHEIVERGLTFKSISYQGYKTSSIHDGHSFFERLLGIQQLIRYAGKSDVLMMKLTANNSPFDDDAFLVAYKRGRGLSIEPDQVTTDFFQYVILMQNSDSNIPNQEHAE